MTSGGGSARRPQLADRGRRRRPSTAFAPSGRRTSGWWAKVAGVSRPSSVPSRIWAGGRGEQVAAADDEVDALAQVVDDDANAVGPVAVPVADRQVAVGRDLVRARSDEAVHPALRAAAERDAQDRPVEAAPATAARAARAVPAPAVRRRPTRSNVVREQSQP